LIYGKNSLLPPKFLLNTFRLILSAIHSLLYGEKSLLGNFLRKNEPFPLWTKLIKPVINNLSIRFLYYTKHYVFTGAFFKGSASTHDFRLAAVLKELAKQDKILNKEMRYGR